MSANNVTNIVKPAYLIAASSVPKLGHSLQAYGRECGPIFLQYGAKAIVVGSSEQEISLLEGSWPEGGKVSLIKFPSMSHLKQCIESDAYQGVKHLRTDITDSYFSIAVEAIA